MKYTILSESPIRFEIDGTAHCEDCRKSTSILTDTLGGYLCDGCAKRFQEAAEKLARYAMKREVRRILDMLPSRRGAA